ncbi:MAG: hypothetical protein ACWGMZ_06855 [Thermoguttaceae bacterium]
MPFCLRALKLTIFSAAVLFGATCSFSADYGNPGGYYGPYGFYGDYGGYGGYVVDDRALTPGESYARGLSDVIRSRGAYNVMSSQAAINATAAQKQEIENREQWTKTYFQMRHENREARIAERRPPPTAEQLVRYAEMGAPKPLSANELDPVSGKIFWPRALRTDVFAESRKQLDELFAKRARYGDVSMEDVISINKLTKKMIAQLEQQIYDLPAMDYTRAKSFLESLAYEVQRSPS